MNAVVVFLPCRDTDAMAAACRRELDLPRDIARELGQSAVRAIEIGRYERSDGAEVDWRADVAAAAEAKISLPPDAVLPTHNGASFNETRMQVVNETTPCKPPRPSSRPAIDRWRSTSPSKGSIA
jgi:hypothetical protein